MTDVTSCPPHRLDVPLLTFDDRGREREVGRLCSGCGRLYNSRGGGFADGSRASVRAQDAAALLPPETLDRLSPRARHSITRLRRATRGRRTAR